MSKVAPGLWGDPGVPKRGWLYADFEDLGTVDAVCEMCKERDIRYVHHLTHPDGHELAVGCVCASKMENEPGAAKQRETNYRNLAKRRQNFPNRKWRTSKYGGNPVIDIDGYNYNVEIFQQGKGYGWRVKHRYTRGPTFATQPHTTMSGAMRAAFDTMINMKSSFCASGG